MCRKESLRNTVDEKLGLLSHNCVQPPIEYMEMVWGGKPCAMLKIPYQYVNWSAHYLGYINVNYTVNDRLHPKVYWYLVEACRQYLEKYNKENNND